MTQYWSYRYRRDMFDVAVDLRVELALYMLSGLCNVMMEPQRFIGKDAAGSAHVAVQMTYSMPPRSNKSKRTHKRPERGLSTTSVLVGDASDVTVHIPPR